MTRKLWRYVWMGALLATAWAFPLVAANPGAGPAQATQAAGGDVDVPSDLRPLLVASQSELRLVVQRYTRDS